MKKNVEIELRGPLTKKGYLELKKFLSKQGKLKGKKNRVLIDYSENFSKGDMKNRQLDVRLRSTNKISEIIVKTGRWGGRDNREEISVLCGKMSFDKLVEIFGLIGLDKGIFCERKIEVYDYKGIEFALINIADIAYTFEAELMGGQGEVEEAHNKIMGVCNKLRLKTFNDKEFFDFIKSLNGSVNKKFEFKNYREGFFRKKYGI